MGQIASVFDCAVNPLAPAPPEDHDSYEGPPRPVVIEPPTPLRDSALWKLQRAFYTAKGVSAWSEAIVPNFVTTNSFIARGYAKVILGLLKDTFEVPPRPIRPGERAPPSGRGGAPAIYPQGTDPTQPVYIVELGAGHGKLGYLIVETLLRYKAFMPPCARQGGQGLPFKYVLTDAFPSCVEAWRAHPSLKDFFDMGCLDVAVFDAEKDTEIRCLIGGETLAAGAPQCANPMVVIANYTFDSLTVDAFRVSQVTAKPAAASTGSSAASASASAGSDNGPSLVLEQAYLALGSHAPEDRVRDDVTGRLIEPALLVAGTGTAGPAADGSGSGSSSSEDHADSSASGGASASASEPSHRVSSRPAGTLDHSLFSRMTLSWSYAPVKQAGGGSGDGSAVAVYGDPLLDSLLTAYLRTAAFAKPAAAPPPASSTADGNLHSPPSAAAPQPSNGGGGGGSVLVPLGGFRALRSLLTLSGGKLACLVGDKGYTRIAEMEGHRDPHVALHGSASLMVNFHALKEVVKAQGGQVLLTPYVDGFKVAALLFGSVEKGCDLTAISHPLPPPLTQGGFGREEEDIAAAGLDAASLILSEVSSPVASVSRALAPVSPPPSTATAVSTGSPFPHARWGFRDGIESFTPEDYSTLQRCVKEEAPNPSLKHLLALLRLGNHDSEVFYKFKQAFIDRSAYPQIHDNLSRDVRGDVDRVYASYFPLVPSKDVCFELGRMLMGLRDYASAIDFFNKSNETCGAHHITFHNAGICFYYLSDYESALECFKQSLELAPDYGEARLWWDRAAMKQQGSAGVAGVAGSSGSSSSGGGGGVGAGAAHEDRDAAFEGSGHGAPLPAIASGSAGGGDE